MTAYVCLDLVQAFWDKVAELSYIYGYKPPFLVKQCDYASVFHVWMKNIQNAPVQTDIVEGPFLATDARRGRSIIYNVVTLVSK